MPVEISTTTIVEARQPISLLGIGEIEQISLSSILENHDPDDQNEDGISGRTRVLEDGQIGRFGWKAQIPDVTDFIADALLQEVGITIHPSLSDFTTDNDFDECADPELIDEDLEALYFFVTQLAAPIGIDSSPLGEALFGTVGCSDCHTPTLDNVPLYSDLLLHDMGANPNLVDQEVDVNKQEFRTPPLWGVGSTAPYMHDGRASTVLDAILKHNGEGSNSMTRFEALTSEEKNQLLTFLNGL